MAVYKPAGISTEAYPGHDTVEARAWRQFQRPRSPKRPYVGIVHRLDRPVSGVLLLARNKSTLRHLNGAFAEKQVKKIYWASTQVQISEGNSKLSHYLVKDPLARRARVVDGPRPAAKHSRLNYRLLRQTAAGFLYEIEPITGRYHQIRAQLAAAGAPIVGDAHYGSTAPYRPNRIMLHARQLTFPDSDGTTLTVTAEPADWG